MADKETPTKLQVLCYVIHPTLEHFLGVFAKENLYAEFTFFDPEEGLVAKEADVVIIDSYLFQGEVPREMEDHCIAHHSNAKLVLLNEVFPTEEQEAMANRSRLDFSIAFGMEKLLRLSDLALAFGELDKQIREKPKRQ